MVTPGWLDHLVACAERDEGLEAVAPLTNRSLTLAYENASPDEIAALVERASAGMILPTESLSGACVLAKTEFPLTTGARVGVCDATYIHTMGAEERVPAVSVGRAPPEERVWLGAQARLQAAPQRQAFIGRGRAEFEGRRVLFVLPVATPGGGANIVISEGLAMRSMGVDVQLYNLPENRAGFENAYPGMRIPVHYGAPEDLAACAGGYDAVVATFNTSVQWLAPLSGGTAIRAYYVQGFEPYVYESGTLQYQTALESYTLYSDLVRFTKTDWTRREVLGATGGDCWVVGPSFELDLFRPRPVDRSPSSSGPVRIAAMVRPFSMYRAPRLTMGLLRRARRRYGDAVEVYLFGIPIDHPEFANLPNDFAWKLAGILEPKQMARMLAMVDVFVDFSEHQAMGLTAMEAMACGNGVIVPLRGGAISFTRHEHNALVVDTSSERDCWHSLQRLIEDQELLALLRTNALRDIVHSYPERAAFNILRVLFASEKGVDL